DVDRHEHDQDCGDVGDPGRRDRAPRDRPGEAQREDRRNGGEDDRRDGGHFARSAADPTDQGRDDQHQSGGKVEEAHAPSHASPPILATASASRAKTICRTPAASAEPCGASAREKPNLAASFRRISALATGLMSPDRLISPNTTQSCGSAASRAEDTRAAAAAKSAAGSVTFRPPATFK